MTLSIFHEVHDHGTESPADIAIPSKMTLARSLVKVDTSMMLWSQLSLSSEARFIFSLKADSSEQGHYDFLNTVMDYTKFQLTCENRKSDLSAEQRKS